jgi:hypothetical protein
MDRDETAIVERLIAYWRGDPAEDGDPSRPSCRQLVSELARSMSAMELLTLQEDPQGHREEIERRVAAWLAARAPSRDVVAVHEPRPLVPPAVAPVQAPVPAAPLPEPAPPAGAQIERGAPGRIEQQIHANDGNILFTVGEMSSPSGGFNLNLPGGWGGGRPPSGAGAGAAAKTVRILFLGANPADSTRLRIGEEVREIESALASAELGSRCELNQKWAVRVADLQGYLLRTKPQIVHFSGHGSRESAILLEGEDGTSRPVAADRLARLLAQFNQRLRCVVLNACYSAVQAEAIAEQIDCVVGMSAAVQDRAAIRFGAAFYRAVASGCSVRAAFDQACADIEIGEWAQDEVPRLLARRCDPATLFLVQG